MYYIGHHPPDREFRTGKVHVDGGEPGRLRHQPDLIECFFQAAYQHFTVEGGDDDFSVDGFDRAVHDHHISIEYAGPCHGIAAHPHKKSSDLIPHQLLVEIDASFHIIVCCRTKAGSVGGRDLLLRKTPGALVAHAEELFEFHVNPFSPSQG